MRITFILLISLLLISCGNKSKTNHVSNAHEEETFESLRWNTSKFPLIIRVPECKKMGTNGCDEYFNGSLELAAIERAAETWNIAFGITVFKISLGGSNLVLAKPQDYLQDDEFVLSFLNNWFDGMNDRVLALTSYSYIDNEMIHADIIFNQDRFSFVDGPAPQSDDVDIESVLVHELGHFLGFKHVDPSIESVMNPNLKSGEQKRGLTNKDIQSIESKYEELFN